jgi:hypothetical protein
MLAVSKLSEWTRRPLFPAVLAGALLAVCVGRREGLPAPPAVPLDDWDIPRLVDHLNGKGLGLRVVSTSKDGVVHQRAFLTTTGKEWADLNRLQKDRKQIDQWRGTLYCERGPGGDMSAALTLQWGDCCLVVGPFLFYGDPDLLARARAALAAPRRP